MPKCPFCGKTCFKKMDKSMISDLKVSLWTGQYECPRHGIINHFTDKQQALKYWYAVVKLRLRKDEPHISKTGLLPEIE